MYSLVLSHLDYCNSLFFGLPDTVLHKAQNIQNWAAKIVLRRGKWESSTQALFDLHWLPIVYRIQFKILTLVFKCIHGQAPDYLRCLIKLKDRSRLTRASTDDLLLYVPFTRRKTFADHSFSVSGPKLWNILPYSIRSADSISSFRSKVKMFLFCKAFNNFT